MAENLFTAYMDYLRFMDSYNAPTEEPAPQPSTLTAERLAKLQAAIEADLDAYIAAQQAGPTPARDPGKTALN